MQPIKDGTSSGEARTLVAKATERLVRMIRDEALKPGDRLPPEHVLTDRLEVSRSVLREAVASLRAEGLVNSRRGSGVFVAAGGQSRPFRISADQIGKFEGVVQLLEMRAAVETEAAGLAAERRNLAQLTAIETAIAALDAELAGGSVTPETDFTFHLAIADATGNPHFPHFLTYIRDLMIPRARLRLQSDSVAASEAYYRMLQREHHQIHQAIAIGDVAGAMAAMRGHIQGSARRYRLWAEEADHHCNGD